MTIYRYNHYNDMLKRNARIIHSIKFNLRTLDSLLDWLINDFPDLVNKYVGSLSACFQKHSNKTYSVTPDEEFPVLEKFPNLAEHGINAYLSFLGYSRHFSEFRDEETEFIIFDLVRATRMFGYQIAIALTSIMSREQALQYFQRFDDAYARKNFSERFENLELYLKKQEQMSALFDQVFKFITEGKLARKVTKCQSHEVLKEVNDPDFCFALSCQGDFELFRLMNPHFILTRTKTLMQNHDMCDFCIHDTRIVETFTHPPPDF